MMNIVIFLLLVLVEILLRSLVMISVLMLLLCKIILIIFLVFIVAIIIPVLVVINVDLSVLINRVAVGPITFLDVMGPTDTVYECGSLLEVFMFNPCEYCYYAICSLDCPCDDGPDGLSLYHCADDPDFDFPVDVCDAYLPYYLSDDY